jgi:hypothetical protein
MNRTVLIIVAVLALLWGLGRVGSALMLLLAVHSEGRGIIFFSLLYLALGGGAIVAGAYILRAQLKAGSGTGAAEAAERHTRRGLKIVGIILALMLGIGGLLLSLCGGIVMQGNVGSGGGALLGVGLLLTVAAVALLVWAIRR